MFKSTNLITFAVIICLFSGFTSGMDLPIRIGCGNNSEIVDGDKVWLAGDNFATTELADWPWFGTTFDYMSPDPAPAEVYGDGYHKNNWCDLEEYDEISIPVADGTYLVRLHMFSNDATHRKMDVAIEGVLVLDDYDPQAEAILLGHSTGVNAIVIPEVIVEVSDGNGMQIRDSAGDMGGGCSDTWMGAVEIFAVLPVVTWDFENGNDHCFSLWSLNPATPAADDLSIAGDESLTGAGGDNGLPDAGLAWTIGSPGMFEGLLPAYAEGCHDDDTPDGTLQYGPCNDPFSAATGEPPYDFTNGRGQSGYLNTYALSQWGDDLHAAENDQNQC